MGADELRRNLRAHRLLSVPQSVLTTLETETGGPFNGLLVGHSGVTHIRFAKTQSLPVAVCADSPLDMSGAVLLQDCPVCTMSAAAADASRFRDGFRYFRPIAEKRHTALGAEPPARHMALRRTSGYCGTRRGAGLVLLLQELA